MTPTTPQSFSERLTHALSVMQAKTLGQGHGIAEINDTDERLLVETLAAIVAEIERLIGENEPPCWAHDEVDNQDTITAEIGGQQYYPCFENIAVEANNALRAAIRSRLHEGRV